MTTPCVEGSASLAITGASIVSCTRTSRPHFRAVRTTRSSTCTTARARTTSAWRCAGARQRHPAVRLAADNSAGAEVRLRGELTERPACCPRAPGKPYRNFRNLGDTRSLARVLRRYRYMTMMEMLCAERCWSGRCSSVSGPALCRTSSTIAYTAAAGGNQPAHMPQLPMPFHREYNPRFFSPPSPLAAAAVYPCIPPVSPSVRPHQQ